MTDHPVKRKLERDVLPYLISARQLRKQWFYRLHTLFGYTTDLVVAFAAIGISSPLLSLLSSVRSAANNGPKPPKLSSALGPPSSGGCGTYDSSHCALGDYENRFQSRRRTKACCSGSQLYPSPSSGGSTSSFSA
jgi:hypothetical protein